MDIGLYVITDEKIVSGRTHAEIARQAIAGGADVIQLRDKTCSARELLRTARELRNITRTGGTILIINDRLDVAIAWLQGTLRKMIRTRPVRGAAPSAKNDAAHSDRLDAEFLKVLRPAVERV